MKRFFYTTVLAIALMSVASGCNGNSGSQAGTQVADDSTTTRVEQPSASVNGTDSVAPEDEAIDDSELELAPPEDE